jgi:hypothetical protein
VSVPAREPALVGTGPATGGDSVVHIGDGGHTSGSGGAHGGADAGSPPSSSGGGGGTDGPTDGPPHGPTDGPSHGSGREWHPSDGDPVLSDADYGPDFTRVHEGPVDAATKAIEDNYGQPMADHGRLDDAQLPPRIEDLPQDVKELGHRPRGAVRTRRSEQSVQP